MAVIQSWLSLTQGLSGLIQDTTLTLVCEALLPVTVIESTTIGEEDLAQAALDEAKYGEARPFPTPSLHMIRITSL